jgi:hypothetical protein
MFREGVHPSARATRVEIDMRSHATRASLTPKSLRGGANLFESASARRPGLERSPVPRPGPDGFRWHPPAQRTRVGDKCLPKREPTPRPRGQVGTRRAAAG